LTRVTSRRAWRWRWLAASLVVVVATYSAWWILHVREGPRLLWTKDAAGFGIGVNDDGSGRPWSVGSIPLCLDRPGAVRIRWVVPVGGDGGITVVGIAIRPRDGTLPANGDDYMLGTSRLRLRSAGFAGDNRVVDVRCAWEKSATRGHLLFYELGVELQSSRPRPEGAFLAVRVDYDSNGTTRHLQIPWAFRICAPGTSTHANCVPPSPLG
jgi:hypothetical protein